MKRIRAVAYIKNEVATWGKMTRAIGFVKEGILAAEIVMRGLDPRIHVLCGREGVDGRAKPRAKPGHDDSEMCYRVSTTLRSDVLPSFVAASAFFSAPLRAASFSTRAPWKPK
jgi:hypothetical protein